MLKESWFVEVIEFARKALGLDPIADAELLHLARYACCTAFWLVERPIWNLISAMVGSALVMASTCI